MSYGSFPYGSASLGGGVGGLKAYFRSLAGSLVWESGAIVRKYTGKRIEAGEAFALGLIGRIFNTSRNLVGDLSSTVGSIVRKGTLNRKQVGSL